MERAVLDRLILLGEQVDYLRGTKLTEQYAQADRCYLLLNGKVNLYINIEEKGKELLVGRRGQAMTPMGWSGLNSPHRYTVTIKVSSSTASLICWDVSRLQTYFDQHPKDYLAFLQFLTVEARKLIRETGKFLDKTNGPDRFSPTISTPEHLDRCDDEALDILRKSPFFEVFDESFLRRILPAAQKRLYGAGQSLFVERERKEGFLLMKEGEVDCYYHTRDGSQVPLRTITSPGYVIGWSGVIGEGHILSASVKTPTEVFFIPRAIFQQLFEDDIELAIAFHLRILWLISNRLQTLRARLVLKRYDQEWLTIMSLIQQNATRLELDSQLNKLPYLLKSPLTLKDAFAILEDTRLNGDSLEKQLSNICLDILQETRREQLFFEGLVKVYKEVSSQPVTAPVTIVRKRCAEEVINTFGHTQYIIEGMDRLPNTGGNIFIYNHLRNHIYNTLPNGFQITLDAHFISSMILYPQYGDPGTRIVRIGRGGEFGHQEYYKRLGHINVFTPESDVEQLTPEMKQQARNTFYHQAAEELAAGRNLIISPEGTSFTTAESPGPFRSGAFNLALSLQKEPLIIPIAVANFDQRVRHNIFKCVIQEPFRVSDHLTRGCSKGQMTGFLNNYQDVYKAYVEDVKALGVTHQVEARQLISA
ncbi:MAG: cyclic nucleotide-binding domain-containing protein [Bacteroidota bacterium]